MKRPRAPFLAAVLAVLCCMAVAGCAATSAVSGAPPMTARTLAELEAVAAVRAAPPRPVVALVLGGGGLRGFAHVGVLHALEEAGIRPDLVVGTSAGAVVGAAYASGLSAAQIERAAGSVKLASLIDFTLSASGVMRGDNIAGWVDAVTGHVPIERFPIRFAAVATDLERGRPVALVSGPAGRAVQASAAVPGIQVPVAHAGGHLVDGGSSSLVPVRFAQAMGADRVIAVDIYCNERSAAGLGAIAVVYRVMHSQACLIAEAELAQADVVVAPSVGAPGIGDRAGQARAVRAGYEAARAVLSGPSVDALAALAQASH